jgi:hypothetical protein
MHQPSAVGIAEEAAIDEHGLYLGARIVDGEAWDKVVAGVYKGFSIGGRVTARDPADRKVITGLALTEISVVDRPANPEAVFDCWKRATTDPPADPAGPPAAIGEPTIRTAGVPPACRPSGSSPGAGAPGRLHVLLAELFELLDDDEALAALASPETLRKQLRPESESESLAAGLAKLADDIVPRLDALQRRVEDIARTPLPPLTAARGIAIAKRDDGTYSAAAPPGYPNDDIVGALAHMTDEERTLTLIKAAHATPLRPIR